MKSKQRRFFIEIAYKGTHYHGWQIQKNALSVQAVFDKALSTVFRQTIQTTGCGRTDTGVHAKQLFAHFDIDTSHLPEAEGTGMDTLLGLSQKLYAINALLPTDIAARNLFEVDADRHARFDAVSRSYEYHIHFDKNPFLTEFSWQIRQRPDVNALNQAAALLLEYTDFSCFSKSHTQVYTNNCTIYEAYWQNIENGRLVFFITANRFLRNMVRAIVGTLMEIGRHVHPVEYIHTVLQSKSRSMAGMSVPAHGLYLTRVNYPFFDAEDLGIKAGGRFE